MGEPWPRQRGMKQSLELKLGQRLTMTPQLQQAIRLLQLSALDLHTEIQQALEENPLLEENEDSADDGDGPRTEDQESDNDGPEGQDSPVTDTDLALSGESPVESDDDSGDWEEQFELPYASSVRNGASESTSFEIDNRSSAPATLREHLYWQMCMTPFTEQDREIAMAIIDAINEDGYLSCALDEICQLLNRDPGYELELDEVETVLHQIQNFDPLGVAARDVSECLLIQLKHFDTLTPGLAPAREIARYHLKLLGNRDFAQLQRLLKIDTAELGRAVKLIQDLHPRPGNAVAPAQPSYIIPDIIVKKLKDGWHAELNADAFPQVRINRTYQSMLRRGDNSADKRYIQDQLQEARWFLKSLHNRNDTLLKVARAIIDRQHGFFDFGEEAMKPMVLHDIAETLSMHESTISRATTQKYMVTPRGIFELKFFFSSHVSTLDGGTRSSTAIRSLIRKLVETESPVKPISDSKIVKLLEEQGITVARRTVAKYRENMNIPPSNQRKSLL